MPKHTHSQETKKFSESNQQLTQASMNDKKQPRLKKLSLQKRRARSASKQFGKQVRNSKKLSNSKSNQILGDSAQH